jgi:hypothetical protein
MPNQWLNEHNSTAAMNYFLILMIPSILITNISWDYMIM